jgi:RNA polymerase sigma-70 factor (ECF subfamily)
MAGKPALTSRSEESGSWFSRRARQGGVCMYEEIEQLYLRYYRELYWFLVKRCPNPDLVDDLIQNTFLEALKSIDGFKGNAAIKTWLFGIAKHQLYRHFRKNNIHVDIEHVPEAELASRTDLSDKLLAKNILAAIEGLDPPHDQIMKLRLVHGLSFKEIGLRLNRTENYCRVNFFRVKEKLRKEYEDETM